MIKIKFDKNSKGTYDFEVIQEDRLLFKKEYQATVVDEATGVTQADTFKGYCKYLQELVDAELAKNPNFKWNSFNDFKKFAGAKTQHAFMAVESNYVHHPKVTA